MRLWTVHPKYLDAKGLVALWREGLLAQKVLLGQTKGYTQHPQLHRFKNVSNPTGAIGAYLAEVQQEAARRGYSFNLSKIVKSSFDGTLHETDGQLIYEWQHLLRKLVIRDPKRHRDCCKIIKPEPHPLFKIIKGCVQDWEKQTTTQSIRKRL